MRQDFGRFCLDGETFAYISDIHIDTWTQANTIEKMERWVSNNFAFRDSDEDSVLLIAGDLGHYPAQNAIFLAAMEKRFNKILYTYGNHELYLFGRMLKRYGNSFVKLDACKEKIEKYCTKTVWMDGDIVEVGKLKIFGDPLWYDFSYGEKIGYSQKYMEMLWHKMMNDSRLIYGKKSNVLDKDFDPLAFFDERFHNLTTKGYDADIILTHVPPVALGNSLYGDSIISAFYSFDGTDFIKTAFVRKWVCGHNHEPNKKSLSIDKAEILLAPMGYGV